MMGLSQASAIASPPSTDILCVGMGWFPHNAGGLDRYVHELTQAWAAGGNPSERGGANRVDLLAIDLPNQSGLANLRLTNLGSQSLPLVQRLWQIRQQVLPAATCVNLHFALYSWPLLLQPSNKALFNKTPITFTFHGPWAGESQREGASLLKVALARWIEQRVYGRCDRFITLSQAFADILHQDYGVPTDKIHVIPGGINTERFQNTLSRAQAREQMGFPIDRPILFTPRRLVQRMGIDKLLDALVMLKQQVPEVWLAIAGKGPQQKALEQQVQTLDLEHNVKFLGYVPDTDLPICYQAADLTVVPSQDLEGFGLILLESLACGTPVLSTPVGGMPEVLRPFDANLVSADQSAGAMGDRLLQFLTGKLDLPSRDACRTYATENFDWQIIAPRVKEVLLRPK